MMRSSIAASAETIRSRQNTRLKDLRQRLLRPSYAHDGLIAIEGEHLVREAARSGLRIETLFLREDRTARKDWPSIGDPLTLTVVADAFDHACATESPQGIAALVEAPQWSFESLLRGKSPRLVVLAGLQDPGNVGTVIRTAEAFAATGVLLTPGSVHPWNQKVLRASAGSSFRLPVVPLDNTSLLRRLSEERVPLYACDARAGGSLLDTDLRGSMAFVIGNEGAGISKEILSFCSGAIHIPCPGPVESLNAGVAAAIVLYEASRQRSGKSIQGKPGVTKLRTNKP
jgi:RNA methyltransferase, TrmH family